jgi:hypothetical protein
MERIRGIFFCVLVSNLLGFSDLDISVGVDNHSSPYLGRLTVYKRMTRDVLIDIGKCSNDRMAADFYAAAYHRIRPHITAISNGNRSLIVFFPTIRNGPGNAVVSVKLYTGRNTAIRPDFQFPAAPVKNRIRPDP